VANKDERGKKKKLIDFVRSKFEASTADVEGATSSLVN